MNIEQLLQTNHMQMLSSTEPLSLSLSLFLSLLAAGVGSVCGVVELV